MQLFRDNNPANFQITHYTANAITVNDTEHTQSLLLMPNLLQPWDVTKPGDLSAADLVPLIALQPEIIILGTGATTIWLPPAVTHIITTKSKIGLEIMNTASACRTYNVLCSEHRRVLAALFMPHNTDGTTKKLASNS